MVEISSGDIRLRIRASALSAIFFRNDFGKDLTKALKDTLGGIAQHADDLDADRQYSAAESLELLPNTYEFLQILYCLNKTQNHAEKISTESFEKWAEEYADIRIMDVFGPVLEEAVSTFQGSGNSKQHPARAGK